ncbi:hypothetical protein H0I25_11845 [Cellulophaga sp. HaHa_2_95]|uniref:hypothetical protein n=1 Tax=Cellulophaga sp. HaHa_2_95 TaxID=2745558 RepID=UPI001C4E4DBC|nr:hypothetical protein [Cellulophaga sp. HaHa_2_95]QXP54779.1 hypothetical protein H0I25_11845 [Cellulophaga sp. HaHa_2_95]
MSSKIIISLFSILLLVLVANGQNKVDYDQVDIEITNHYKDYKYSNKKRPGYYLQVNNQNCYYDIRLNDLNINNYFREYPAYSVRKPLNLRILKSGEQLISVKVFPVIGEKLSEKAGLQLQLVRYSDMTDPDHEFGRFTVLWEWEMPKVGDQKIPEFTIEHEFDAKVPFVLETLDLYAQDLSELEEEDVLKEVIEHFTIKRQTIINKTQDRDHLERHLKRALIQLYKGKELSDKTIDGMINIKDGMEPQPLEDFEIKYYYNNKVVTLVRRSDKQPAIWFKNPNTGSTFKQPYYIFKNKETGTWHMW